MFGVDKHGKDMLAGQFGSGGPETMRPDLEMQMMIDGWTQILREMPIGRVRERLAGAGVELNSDDPCAVLARVLAERDREEIARIASGGAILRTKR